jgi:NAD(P) transhydrogenase subunit alpha
MGFFSASEVSVEDVQRDYGPILVPGEQVVAAFRTVRDIIFLTNFRLALVDVQGLTGRKFEVVTDPLSVDHAVQRRDGGSFDLDADLKVWVTGDPVPLEVKISRKVDPAGSSRSWRAACSGECRHMDFIAILSIFVLACFVGYFVVWGVTPALHTPLMAVTNAISSVIIVGALIASAAAGSPSAKWLGLAAVVMASINIFGGFAVTERMLAMYKKKERK